MIERISWMISPPSILEPSLQQALNGEPIAVIKLGKKPNSLSLIVLDTQLLTKKGIATDEIMQAFQGNFNPEELTDYGFTSEESRYRLLMITPLDNQTDTDRIATSIHSVIPQE